MNSQACLLLAVALSLSRCGAQQLRIGAQALDQLTLNNRGDVTHQTLGPDFAHQFAMIVYPEATGLQASNYYLHDIKTFIDQSITTFRLFLGDVSARTGMFVGCSSGNAAANV